MKSRRYVFTPARRAALRKATEASAKKRKQSATRKHSESVANAFLGGGIPAAQHKAGAIAVSSARRRIKKVARKHIPTSFGKTTPRNKSRGSGLSGLKRNAIPYARVNNRGSTVGINAGTLIPGTKKRIVVGGYAKVETTRAHTAVDKAIAGRKAKLIPLGSRRAKVAGRAHSFLSQHGALKNPALRAQVAGSQVRLGTSRKGGPTLIVRRGSHRTPGTKSRAGVQKYDRRMSTIAGHKAKKPRPQRRKAARKRK